jgi:peroxiredoxin Q/BCP
MIRALKSKIKSAFLQGELKVKEGERLPVFKLENQRGEEIRSENIENGVVYFFPKAGTPGCTDEACRFRDEFQRFDEMDAEVYGISTDSREKLKEFADSQDLEFHLLSDKEKQASKKFGVLTKAGFAERTTFVVKDGVIRRIIRDVDPEEHVERALEELEAGES